MFASKLSIKQFEPEASLRAMVVLLGQQPYVLALHPVGATCLGLHVGYRHDWGSCVRMP